MVIREVKPSKRVAGRWLVALEDGSLLRVGENEVADFVLYPGRELSDGAAEQLPAAVRRSGWRTKALGLLARKPQSRRELEKRLREWGADEETSAALCGRMEELGYLDDAAYAAQIVRHYSSKGFGERKLRDELYRRGVPRELWEDALEEAEDPREAIDAFVAKRLAGAAPDRAALKKVSDALARRGYAWPDITAALRRYGAETGEE